MKPTQYTVIGLIVFLLALEIVRSDQVKFVLQNAVYMASGNVSAKAHGSTAPTPPANSSLDWRLILYWGIAAILLIALAGAFPRVVTMLLILIIVEELLVNWKKYTTLLQQPTK